MCSGDIKKGFLEEVGLDLGFQETVRLNWVKRDVSRNVELPSQGPVPQMAGPDQPV